MTNLILLSSINIIQSITIGLIIILVIALIVIVIVNRRNDEIDIKRVMKEKGCSRSRAKNILHPLSGNPMRSNGQNGCW